jgi:hypothetical protein
MVAWVVVFSGSSHEAELVLGMLDANDIKAVLLDNRSSSYPMMGETEVRVAQNDVLMAHYLVRKHSGT